jgi:hypothetical protein
MNSVAENSAVERPAQGGPTQYEPFKANATDTEWLGDWAFNVKGTEWMMHQPKYETGSKTPLSFSARPPLP